MAARVVAEYLTLAGLRASPRMAWDMGLQTDSCFGAARPTEDSPRMMRAAWEASRAGLLVTTGNGGKDRSGAVTRLGHAGGDLSAALFGAALQAEEVQLWTDFSRTSSTAPRLVRAARVLSRLIFAEYSERAVLGARDLDTDSMEPTDRPTIPVRVMDTRAPEGPGILFRTQGALEGGDPRESLHLTGRPCTLSTVA